MVAACRPYSSIWAKREWRSTNPWRWPWNWQKVTNVIVPFKYHMPIQSNIMSLLAMSLIQKKIQWNLRNLKWHLVQLPCESQMLIFSRLTPFILITLMHESGSRWGLRDDVVAIISIKSASLLRVVNNRERQSFLVVNGYIPLCIGNMFNQFQHQWASVGEKMRKIYPLKTQCRINCHRITM